MNEETDTNEKTVAKSYNMFSLASWDDLKNILGKVNAVARMDVFNLPEQIDKYYNVEDNSTASVLANVLLEAERSEDWRMSRYGSRPKIITDKNNDAIYFVSDDGKGMMTLKDTKGYIIIADLQTIIIVPGIESIKSGSFRPNEAIRLVNLLLDTTLFCKLLNVPIEGMEGKYNLGFDLKIIGKQDD